MKYPIYLVLAFKQDAFEILSTGIRVYGMQPVYEDLVWVFSADKLNARVCLPVRTIHSKRQYEQYLKRFANVQWILATYHEFTEEDKFVEAAKFWRVK